MSGEQDTSQLREFDPKEFKCIVDSGVGELGCGRHCSIRLADHFTMGWVAVKCFQVTGGDPQKRELVKKMRRGLKMIQQAMGNYTLRYYGWVKWLESVGLVMEYMPGGSLGQFLSDDTDRLPLKVILRMLCETSEGIAYLHNLPSGQSVVHGNLKPDNVLLSSDMHCKLSDLGCAHFVPLTDNDSTTMNSQSEKCDVTMAYAPPERLSTFNIKPQREQDTYSFGMVLYALLAGSPPYQLKSQEGQFVESIKRGERPDTTPIEELKEKLCDGGKQILGTLQSIMTKCWRQDPSKRPTMIEVRNELQKLLRRKSTCDISAEVLETLKTMSISIPIADEHQLLPLNHFSPLSGTFAQGSDNIFSMPNVDQGSIDHRSGGFNQVETDMDSELPSERKLSLADLFDAPAVRRKSDGNQREPQQRNMNDQVSDNFFLSKENEEDEEEEKEDDKQQPSSSI